MKKSETIEAAINLFYVIAFTAVVVGVAWGILLGFNWLGKQMSRELVCVDKVMVIETRPYYEDNGRYEDEAFEVTYKDGSKGIIDNPSDIKTGYMCRKMDWE